MNARGCLLLALPWCAWAATAPAPAVAPSGADTVQIDLSNFDIIPPRERWQFNPPPQRRDVFYDLEATLMAQAELARLNAEAEQQALAAQNPIIERPVAGLQDALDRAKVILSDVQQLMAKERYDDALKLSSNGAKLLRAMAKGQNNAEVNQLIERLERYAQLAEEAKLLQEAKAEFAKIGLTVEGIMWSADDQSLAIISGETFAEQDRVKNILITNIDVNRVDFLFTYRSRRFEFQRYIGE